MLRAIRRKFGHSMICCLANAEEGLPFQDASFAYVFSSFTYHQMKSPARFFREMWRVLGTGGRFVLIGATREQALRRELLRFFPKLASVEEQRYLSLDKLLSTFWRAGFVHVKHNSWHFETRSIDETYLGRVRLGQINSALSFLTPAELQEGLTRIEQAIPRNMSFDIDRTVISGVRPKELDTGEKVRCFLRAAIPNVEDTKECAGGVMNYVFRVRKTDGSTIIVKQGTSRARSSQISTTLSEMSPERTADEFHAMAMISDSKIDWGVRIPRIFGFAADSNLLIMEDIGCGATLMPKLGDVPIERRFDTYKALARFLALLHSAYERQERYIRGQRERDYAKWQSTFHLRTTDLCNSKEWPDAQDNSMRDALSQKAVEIRNPRIAQTLVNPDLCPKNVFVYDESDKPGVFDFEFCTSVGDPIFDLGFLVGHAVIDSAVCGVRLGADECVTAYDGIRPLGDRITDVGWYAACTIIYRLYGASRLAGIVPEAVAVLRRAASSVIMRGAGRVSTLISRL